MSSLLTVGGDDTHRAWALHSMEPMFQELSYLHASWAMSREYTGWVSLYRALKEIKQNDLESKVDIVPIANDHARSAWVLWSQHVLINSVTEWRATPLPHRLYPWRKPGTQFTTGDVWDLMEWWSDGRAKSPSWQSEFVFSCWYIFMYRKGHVWDLMPFMAIWTLFFLYMQKGTCMGFYGAISSQNSRDSIVVSTLGWGLREPRFESWFRQTY